MRTRTPILISLRACLLALPLLSLACNNQPIDPTALATQAALNAREVVHQSGGGVAFTQSSDSGLQKIVSGMAHATDGLSGNGMSAMMPTSMPPGTSAMAGSPMAQAAAGMPSMLTTEEQFDSTADDLKTFLRERILTESNLETKSNDEAVYLLKGDPTCRALPRDTDPPGTLPTLDTKCVDQLNKLAVRIVMRVDGDGVRLTIELGPDKLELAAFVIHSNLLAVDVDFAKTYAATQYAQQTLGQDNPMGDTQFDKLVGAIRVSLQKDGDKQVTFATAVLSAIDVAESSASSGPGPELKLAASNPLVALTLDGAAQTATVKVAAGALDVFSTYHMFNYPAVNRDLHVAVGGITGEMTFKEGIDELVAKGVGVGATSIKAHGQSFLDIGLNPADMNRFDLKITVDTAGEPHFEITPRFDLSIAAHLKDIAGDYGPGDAPKSYLLDEVYGIKLDNGGAPATLEAVPASGAFAGGLKVDAGTLTLSSSKATAVTVPMGQCLTGVSSVPPTAHPLLGAFTTTTCP
jgi:hypothetical protein